MRGLSVRGHSPIKYYVQTIYFLVHQVTLATSKMVQRKLLVVSGCSL